MTTNKVEFLRNFLIRIYEWGKERKAMTLPLLILLFGFGMMKLLVFLKQSPPKLEKEKVAILVDAIQPKIQNVRIPIKGYGTVAANQFVVIQPQVTGKILKVNPKLQIGGRFKKGELLYQIEKSDYEIAVDMKKASLARAEFELQVEEGNQIVAKREWELAKGELQDSSFGTDLVLRKPHLLEKKAARFAAKSDLRQANINLERTTILSPFPSVVVSETVEVGQFVSPQIQTVSLASIDKFIVEVRVSREYLNAITFNDNGEPEKKVEAQIKQNIKSGESYEWDGYLVRLISNVDENARMLRLLVAIDSPLQVNKKRPPLLLGSYVEVTLKGNLMKNLYKVPRKSVREGNTIWIASSNNKLLIKGIEPVFNKNNFSFIRAEIHEGEKVVTSNISEPLKGKALDVQEIERIQKKSSNK